MHYVKFVKDYPAIGKKAGDIVRYHSKVPPHVEKYVNKSSQSAYEKQQAGEAEETEISGLPEGNIQGSTSIATPEDKPKRNAAKLPNDVTDKPKID